MTETEFLNQYDPEAFPKAAVTVDLALIGVVDGVLSVLLQRRANHPFKGDYALPGGFVGPAESIETAARRVLREKARIERFWLEQLYTFGDPDRDPRMRIVTVAHYALMPEDRLKIAAQASDDLILAQIKVDADAVPDASAVALSKDGAELPLAFDHPAILGHVAARLRGKLDYAPIAFSLLPQHFTLRELQAVHEAILGRALSKPPFRRRMLDQGWIKPTGSFETGSAFRPAELYQFSPKSGE